MRHREIICSSILVAFIVFVASGCGGGESAAPEVSAFVPGAKFPLDFVEGNRYLVDADGKPFLLHGDSAWSAIAELTREEAEQYLEDRRQRGFNAILVNLLEGQFASQAPRNAYGAPPFTVENDYSTPNETYFLHVDWLIAKASEKGILVLLVPSYLGFGGGTEGWYQAMLANGEREMREYGRYLGRRYQNYENILWVHGGDFNPPLDAKALVREIALGIKEFDIRSLHTAHCAPETSALDYWSGESWLAVDSVYTYGAVFEAAGHAYTRPDALPFMLIESRYENEAVPEGSEQRVRVQAYQALLSGAIGHVFGNNPVWHFSGPGVFPSSLTWQQSLDSPGARSMTHLRSLFAERAWWALVPDSTATLLTDGLGAGLDRATAALAENRLFALAYVPSTRPITLDFSQLAGPNVRARWYDPSAGLYSDIYSGPIPAFGSVVLVPPVANTSGHDDWVVTLDSTE